jgi:lysophospholipase L1-like esterase
LIYRNPVGGAGIARIEGGIVMKKLWVYAIAMSLSAAGFVSAQSASAPATQGTAEKQHADVAAPKIDAKTGKPQGAFVAKHAKYVERAKQGGIDLLFEGDSITEGWMNKNGKEVWQTRYVEKYGDKVANFGIGGDRTQHVLWRNDDGELENIHPKVVVLMIGTNNSGSDPAEEIANGVTKIVKQIRDKTGAKVLLLSVFPRGQNDENAQRKVNAQVNEQIKKLDDGTNVRYLEIWKQFLDKDGDLSKDIMPDYLHPNQKGYEIWADAMQPLLDEMMGGSGSSAGGNAGGTK